MKGNIIADRNEIRQLRQERDWSLAHLAKATGIHSSRLSTIERGLAIVVSARDQARIADALGVAVEEAFPSYPPEDEQE